MRIYVGKLPYSANDAELSEKFAEFGAVESAKVIMDNQTGQSKGFGFVEMPSAEEANAAVAALNGYQWGRMAIVVNEARPPEPRTGNFNDRNNDRGNGGGGYQSRPQGGNGGNGGF